MGNIKHKIKCMGYPLSYTLVVKQVKNINMHINEDGEIMVSANAFVPVDKIDEFVSNNIKWILKSRQRMMQKKEMIMISQQHVVLLGRKLKIKKTAGKYNDVHYDADVLYVQLKEGADQNKIIAGFLDKLCRDIFYDIAHLMHKKLEDYHIAFPEIKVRTMKTRWGSCTPSKQLITLNRRLIHYPIEFTEYVVLHEFVHFIQPNHSKAFYNIIEYHMPDYKNRITCAG